MRKTAIIGLIAGALLAAGCGSSSKPTPVAAPKQETGCPAKWKATYQKLADRIHAPVYCPRWMPDPLTGEIGPTVSFGGAGGASLSVDKDRSYLALFVWAERGSGEIHVNLRGYPGRTKVPTCVKEDTNGAKLVKTTIPCFSDPGGVVKAPGIVARVYTVNQDADLWHILYAWHHAGGLYTVSQHVAPPLTYRKVELSLQRILNNLVLVQPHAA